MVSALVHKFMQSNDLLVKNTWDVRQDEAKDALRDYVDALLLLLCCVARPVKDPSLPHFQATLTHVPLSLFILQLTYLHVTMEGFEWFMYN